MSDQEEKKSEIPKMSEETKARLQAVGDRFKGKEMFPEAVARAKAFFLGLKELPHQKFPELFGDKNEKD